MDNRELIFFVYGLCTMFYLIMVWIFGRKGKETLSRLVTLTTGVISLQCLKDCLFYHGGVGISYFQWQMMSAWDMVTVPIYSAILVELCKPGKFSWRTLLAVESVFLLFPVLLFLTKESVWFEIGTCWCGAYGIYFAIWTLISIPRYNRALKERFSYDENINLRWLRYILYSFFVLLTLWIIDCIHESLVLNIIYMISSMGMWMIICYFLYQHEFVVGELSLASQEEPASAETKEDPQEHLEIDLLGRKIEELFRAGQVYLNPNLKLSDVTRMVGSNRTYVSKWFNQDSGLSFYDYVNRYRIEHACRLLLDSSDTVMHISDQSGFNSLSTFHRIFTKLKGMTPNEYRLNRGKSK